MSGILFGRKYEVVVGDRKFTNDQFSINFDIPFDDGADANIAEIEIYNLKNSTINVIRDGQKIILNAGYQTDVGAILIGTAKRPTTDWSGVDLITTINVLDGNDTWMEKQINKTYKENITGKQILADLLKLTGLKIGSFELPLNMVYTSAKTIKDKLGKSIVEIAQDCNAKIHVNRGKIFIRAKAKGDDYGFILDKDHGLIGSPTPIETKEEFNIAKKIAHAKKVRGHKAKKATKKKAAVAATKDRIVTTYTTEYENVGKTRRGYKVKSLLHHKITTDSIIQIKSHSVNGKFRVEKGRHYANGSSYYTEMEVYPL